ncbi:MAG TPA: metallophosphoesterase [Thermoanaerobaculaceae bacterium]|nr:metallophosphoesterase [Thermoanaerobaculaceae bacterium]
MLRAVLADLHVGQVPGDLDRFVAAVETLRGRGAGEVVFLGDLFRALVGFSRFWDDTVRAGLEAVAALRRDGARVVLVEGNRDFFLDAPALDPYRDAAGTAHSFTAGGRRFLLEHGDLLNHRDRAYRFWRAVSKSGPARVWARLLPKGLARRIVLGTESRLKETNFTYRRELPLDDLESAARRHFAAGVDVVLWGHFHRAWSMREGSREARVVPGWMETGTVVWIGDDGGLELEPPESGQFVDTPAGSWYQSEEVQAEAR